MRLLLEADTPPSVTVPDQWLTYTSDDEFSITQYIAAGYDSIDYYLAGAGGGGGGGGIGQGTSPDSSLNGGGGGGGGGGGAFRSRLGVLLTSLSGITPITLGVGGAGGDRTEDGEAGGNTTFNDLTAFGGGGGGCGSGATGANPGYGGNGGAGGGRNSVGDNGASGSHNGSAIAAGASGGGSGGRGADNSDNATNATNGKSFTDDTDYGGGGGAGGGRGTPTLLPTTGHPASHGGKGGKGYLSENSAGLDASTYWYSIDSSRIYYGGAGAGAGGGVNFMELLGIPDLDGAAGWDYILHGDQPGGGGFGGGGDVFIGTGHGLDNVTSGGKGGKGAVILRVYKA